MKLARFIEITHLEDQWVLIIYISSHIMSFTHHRATSYKNVTGYLLQVYLLQ